MFCHRLSGDQPAETMAKHRELARLSSQGRHVVAANGGHWIQFDKPDLVATTIREIVERARDRKDVCSSDLLAATTWRPCDERRANSRCFAIVSAAINQLRRWQNIGNWRASHHRVATSSRPTAAIGSNSMSPTSWSPRFAKSWNARDSRTLHNRLAVELHLKK